MKTKQDFEQTEKQINAHLAAMPADRRPELGTRRRAQSIAYASGNYYEVTDSDGHTEMVSAETVESWVKL